MSWSIDGPATGAARALWECADPPARMGATGKNTGRSRLGWLDLPGAGVPDYRALREELLDEGFRRLTVVGMGGAGLSSVTLASVLAREAPGLSLGLLATLDPDEVRGELERRSETVFLIASRSGATAETRALEAVLARQVGPGRQMLALTAPGSPLEVHARESGYRRIFHGHPGVGGRFAALDAYGAFPAALAGHDVERGLDAAREARAELDGDSLPDSFRAGEALAALASVGLLRVRLSASPAFAGLLPWLEQLFAESLGKEGKGVLPGAGGGPRIHVGEGGPDAPLVRSRPAPGAGAGELFRWQVAVGVAGALMGVDPYDQPDIDGSKARARTLRAGGAPPAATGPELAEFLRRNAGGGLVLNAYGARNPENEAALGALRREFPDPPALAWGPGLLHSFGQLQKGGPRDLAVLQITWGVGEDLVGPDGRGLGELAHLLALADFEEMRSRGRPVCRAHDPAPGPAAVLRRIREAL